MTQTMNFTVLKKDCARREKQMDKGIATSENSGTLYWFSSSSSDCKDRSRNHTLYLEDKLACRNYTFFDIGLLAMYGMKWIPIQLHTVLLTSSPSSVLRLIISFIAIIYDMQNRNVNLYQYPASNKIIEQKFLTKGHTQVECDNVHGQIEKKEEKQRSVSFRWLCETDHKCQKICSKIWSGVCESLIFEELWN